MVLYNDDKLSLYSVIVSVCNMIDKNINTLDNIMS